MSSRTRKLLSDARIRKEAIDRLAQQVNARIEKIKQTHERSEALIEKAQEARPFKTPDHSE